MTRWRPSADYLKIAEANREFYARTANQYESTETCVNSPRLQAEIEADLDRILALIGKPPKEVRALDACGGSGNVAMKLLGRGVNVVLVDISPDLQSIYSRKCVAMGLTSQVVCSEIAAFMAEAGPGFDLIIFSSALHHLESIDEVLALAFGRLTPGGVLFTMFDPTLRERVSRLSRFVLRLEYFGFKAFFQTADLPRAIRRRLSRILAGSKADNKSQVILNQASAGMLAEYHVEKGIDDLALAGRLQKMGYEIVRHERRPDARFRWTSWIIGRLNDVTSFKLLLRKPAKARPAMEA